MKLRKDSFSWTKAYIKGTCLGFCSYNFCILMRIHEFLELYSFHSISLRIYFAGIFSPNFCFLFQNRKFGVYLCKMPPKKRSTRRGSHEAERMSTRDRSPEVDEAAGMDELVVGVEDPLEMSDTAQGDFGLET